MFFPAPSSLTRLSVSTIHAFKKISNRKTGFSYQCSCSNVLFFKFFIHGSVVHASCGAYKDNLKYAYAFIPSRVRVLKRSKSLILSARTRIDFSCSVNLRTPSLFPTFFKKVFSLPQTIITRKS